MHGLHHIHPGEVERALLATRRFRAMGSYERSVSYYKGQNLLFDRQYLRPSKTVSAGAISYITSHRYDSKTKYRVLMAWSHFRARELGVGYFLGLLRTEDNRVRQGAIVTLRGLMEHGTFNSDRSKIVSAFRDVWSNYPMADAGSLLPLLQADGGLASIGTITHIAEFSESGLTRDNAIDALAEIGTPAAKAGLNEVKAHFQRNLDDVSSRIRNNGTHS